MVKNIKQARLHWANGEKTVQLVDVSADVVGVERADGEPRTFAASTLVDPDGLKVYVEEPAPF